MKKYRIIGIGTIIIAFLLVVILIVLGFDLLFSDSVADIQDNPYVSNEPVDPVEELYEDLCDPIADPGCYQGTVDLESSNPEDTLPDTYQEHYPIIEGEL